jgi:predicted ATP-grasp superfamily ATP-dependent carboligase
MEHAVLVVTGDLAVGLAVIRSLGRHGVVTHTCVSGRSGLGRYSRYTKHALQLPRDIDEEGTRIIADYCQANGITHIIGVSEPAIIFINEFRHWFEPHVELLFPPREIFHRALYKEQTVAIASHCSINVPKTFVPSTVAEAESWAEAHYPVMLKPRHRDVARGPSQTYLLKADPANTREDLLPVLDAYQRWGDLPLLQQYVPGVGISVGVLMRGGNPVCLMQYRRLCEYPLGVSAYSESMKEWPNLADQSISLLRAMKWEGVAMVEYRHDESNGNCWLMEVNGRFWGSLPLALHSGVEFPYALYRSSLETMKCPRATSGVRARSLAGHTKWLYSVFVNGGMSRIRALWEYIRAFFGSQHYFVWTCDDPKPAIMKLLNRFRRRDFKLLMTAEAPVRGTPEQTFRNRRSQS